jgi:NADH-quinone oxidoreductase subunit B
MSSSETFLVRSPERRGLGYALSVVDVGLACCALEFAAATQLYDDVFTALEPRGTREETGQVHVLVVSGTVTRKNAARVRAAYQQLPEPRRVMSFGSCSNSGGPYWDSYAVVPGVADVIPVDVYVPGCPPRPEAVLDGLRELDRLLGEGAA